MALLSDSQAEFTKDIIDQLSEKDLDNLLKVLGAETQEKPIEISDTYYDLLRLCKIVKFVFDTGCSTTLTMPDVHNMLINQRDSRLSISLAHGKTSVSAAKHGQLISYPIGADAAISQPLKIAVDTVPGLNQSLLSSRQSHVSMTAGPQAHVKLSPSLSRLCMYRRCACPGGRRMGSDLASLGQPRASEPPLLYCTWGVGHVDFRGTGSAGPRCHALPSVIS